MAKNGAIKDKTGYAAWALRNRRCTACGIPATMAATRMGAALTTHHIVKLGRSDEPCNLLRLCFRCHQCAEGMPQLTAQGKVVPILTMANVLWLKKYRNPKEWNLERLVELRTSNLPEPEAPDAFFIMEYARHGSD